MMKSMGISALAIACMIGMVTFGCGAADGKGDGTEEGSTPEGSEPVGEVSQPYAICAPCGTGYYCTSPTTLAYIVDNGPNGCTTTQTWNCRNPSTGKGHCWDAPCGVADSCVYP